MKISRIVYIAVFALLTSYVYILPGYTQVLPATCEALVTDIDMWSQDAKVMCKDIWRFSPRMGKWQ